MRFRCFGRICSICCWRRRRGRSRCWVSIPGLRTGCKVAVVDETGKFLAHDVIYPHSAEERRGGCGDVRWRGCIERVQCSRDRDRQWDGIARDGCFCARLSARGESLSKIFSVTVNESGASIYSASEIARQEFPDLDLTVRGAISIARRLQDPLAELVKVDPKSIGVGQYQHDVDQRQLQQSLESVIESLRESGGRGSEYCFVDAAAVCGGYQGADGAEDCGVPE